MWLGRLYEGQHQPLIGRDLFERVQRVFVAANHPPHGTKRQHSFVGLVKCARCGCSFTAELRKGLYVYYHCTGSKGPCGNGYICEEDLGALLGDSAKRVRILTELAESRGEGASREPVR
jgi:site-specific DNA recombinase